MENKKIRKGKEKGRRSPRLWISSLIILLALLTSWCRPRQVPPGFSGWFSVSSDEGILKGRFYFLPGKFLRIEVGKCAFILLEERAEIYDKRKKEKWAGPIKKIREEFPQIPTLEEMEEIWRGRGVVRTDKKGWPRIFIYRTWTVRLFKIKRGAWPGEKHEEYRKTKLERICSRFVHTQK